MSRDAIVEIDVGNTRAKWRFMFADGSMCDGACEVPSLVGLPREGVRVTCARVASVRGEDFERQLASQIATVFGVVAQFARSAAKCAGVTNAYAEPSALGVDRWLAMLSAFRRSAGACMIVDAGSAITLDSISSQGIHLGGYIVPGLAIQSEALLRGTQILRPKDISFDAIALGESTREAISNGILSMVVAWVEAAKNGAAQMPILFVTGGDAPVISKALRAKGVAHECVPELVFEGLALALQDEVG